jgi:thiol-disulfide isomerase/thioredoxin
MNRGRILSWAFVVGAATAVALSGCTAAGGDTNTFQYTNATPLDTLIPVAARRPAEPISGQLLDGAGQFQLDRYRGKIVVLNFWASWCGPCRIETPQLAQLYRKVGPTGVQFVGIDTKDSRPSARAFVAQDHVTYPIVFDQEGQIQLRLGNIPGSLPFTVLVDRRGRVAAVYLSQLTSKDLTKPLATLRGETVGNAG